MKNESQPHERPFFLLSVSKNRVEKSYFYQQLWVFEIIIKIFNCIKKNDDISNIMGT